jgi:hypothetical protein
MRRSSVLSLPLQLGLPDQALKMLKLTSSSVISAEDPQIMNKIVITLELYI